MKKILVIFTTVVLLIPTLSLAEISLQTPQSTLNLQSLPSPFSEFIGNLRDINNSFNTQISKYFSISPIQAPISFEQISKLSPNQWIQNIQNMFQNTPLSGLYSIVVKIIQTVGNIVLWILETAIDLIKGGLSMLR